MTMIKIKRNWKNVGSSQTANVGIVMIVIKYTKIPALNLKKTGICESEKEDCDLGHPDICNRLQRDSGCRLRSCNYLHPEVTRDSQNRRYRNNYYKNPKNFRFSKNLQERRSSRYKNNRTPRYNYRRPSYRPNDHQSYPNNIKISDTNNSNKPFLGTQLSLKELEIINALGRIINSQKD